MVQILPRHLESVLLRSLHDFPAALLVGPRQAGKSTLAQSLAAKAWPASYVTLDDRTSLDAALTNPDGFLEGVARPAVLDEIRLASSLAGRGEPIAA